ncbi:MAG: HNH endonuclease [Luteimonas sp.]
MTALSEFLRGATDLARETPDKRNEWWRHKLVFDRMENRCVYCGAILHLHKGDGPGRRGCMDHIVPVRHGGPQQTENLVPACYSCNIIKASDDLLSWPPPCIEPEALQSLVDRRLRMLAWAENHLLRNPRLGKRKDTVIRHLARRWQHPRVLVFAALTEDGGFIMLPKRGLPAELVPLLRGLGARPIGHLVFQVSSHRFHDAIWALIDHNALVRQVELPGHPDPTPQVPGDAEWPITFSTVLDVKRRRPKIQPIRKPRIERPMDWGQRLLIELRSNWVPNGKFDWDWVNAHKETDCAWARKERERLAREHRELEAAVASLPPPFTVDYFLQELDRRIANPKPGDPLERLARENGIEVSTDPACWQD